MKTGISSSVLWDLQGNVALEETVVAFATLFVLRVIFARVEISFGDWLEEKVNLTPTFLLSSPTVSGHSQVRACVRLYVCAFMHVCVCARVCVSVCVLSHTYDTTSPPLHLFKETRSA